MFSSLIFDFFGNIDLESDSVRSYHSLSTFSNYSLHLYLLLSKKIILICTVNTIYILNLIIFTLRKFSSLDNDHNGHVKISDIISICDISNVKFGEVIFSVFDNTRSGGKYCTTVLYIG